MIDTKKAEPSLLDTPIVCDYPDVFLEELLGLPPYREIEFAIDVVPSATPTSITPLITTQIVLFHTLNTPGFEYFLHSNQPN